MKILKEKSRVYKGQVYYKFKVNIPQTALSQSGLRAGDELDITFGKQELILRKKKT